ncbi:malonate decarboxylase holo-ACP synthase [Stutzerimonas balearica]|uniref:malonate decarboxylase holo-ACP synthase n=1 Tax=Stutzerimonas balearica TaxID=74829 RepID=UPI0028970A15|nr:malonate decarboxylase holo-ACP synthase [Stutzerimonas balearica]
MHDTPRPHDLLWGMTSAQLPADAPAWAIAVLAAGQPVVVRRARVALGEVVVGVRGASRDQRYATSMALGHVLRCVSPEQLVQRLPTAGLPALHALELVKPMLDALGYGWGVTGSVGYQLATGLPTVTTGSDLDLLLRVPEPLSRDAAAELLALFDGAPSRIDMQLETPNGAIALREWAGQTARVLLKCATGARLVADPWRLASDGTERVA